MNNPLKAFARRLEQSRSEKNKAMEDQIEKVNPGGVAGWERQRADMPEWQRTQLKPMVSRGMEGFAKRIQQAREKVKSVLKKR